MKPAWKVRREIRIGRLKIEASADAWPPSGGGLLGFGAGYQDGSVGLSVVLLWVSLDLTAWWDL